MGTSQRELESCWTEPQWPGLHCTGELLKWAAVTRPACSSWQLMKGSPSLRKSTMVYGQLDAGNEWQWVQGGVVILDRKLGDGTGDVRALDVWVENTLFKGRLEARVNRIHRNCQRYMNDTYFFNFLLCALLKKQKKMCSNVSVCLYFKINHSRPGRWLSK